MGIIFVMIGSSVEPWAEVTAALATDVDHALREVTQRIAAAVDTGPERRRTTRVSPACLAARLERWWSHGAVTELDTERAREVGLACAAAAGCPEASEALSLRIREAARDSIVGTCSAGSPEELAQECWLRLMMPTEDPRILRYAGRGALDGLLRVVATRLALNRARDVRSTEAVPEELPERFDFAAALEDAQYRDAWTTAFERAIASLEEQERLLLRLHLTDRLTIDQLALVLGVHRATAARRLERARQRVAVAVRAELEASLGAAALRPSLMNDVRSRLDLSLSRIFAATPEEMG